MAFTAEAVVSSGANFDTFVVSTAIGSAGSSAHIPLSVIAWGADSANLAVTDTAAPFPVQLFGNGLASTAPLYVRGLGDSTIPVSGTVAVSSFGQSSVTIANDSTTPVPGNITRISTDTNVGAMDATNSAIRVNVVAGGDANDTTVTIGAAVPQSSVTVESGSITVTNNSTDLLFVSDSATPVFVRGLTNSTIPVTTDLDTTVTISNASFAVTVQNDTGDLIGTQIAGIPTAGNDGGAIDSTNSAIRVNVVAGSAGGDSTITITNDTTDPIGVANTSAGAIFVRGVGDSTVPVSGTITVSNPTDTTFTQTGYVAPSTTVTVTNIADNDTTVTVSNSSTGQIGVVSNAVSGSVGAVTPLTLQPDSTDTSIMTAVGRLYGYSMSNPDTATDAWINIFDEDTAGVTLGTTVPKISVMVPFGGGREAWFDQGLHMSSGMAIAAAGGPSTDHTAPSTTLTVTLYYEPST